MDRVLPYGSWPSPVTADRVIESAVGLGGLWVEGDALWWTELRPAEQGRVAVVRHTAGEGAADRIDGAYSARTRVHEYGGGAFWLKGESLFFANWADNGCADSVLTSASPSHSTPEPSEPMALRYADGRVTPDGAWIICVRESHEDTESEARNEIVAVPTDGGETIVLFSESDFVASPRIDASGRRLCWTAWDHPNMPWDRGRLFVARIDADASKIAIADVRVVAGERRGESIVQPEWSPTGNFTSSRIAADGGTCIGSRGE